jgi:hypothetical protein
MRFGTTTQNALTKKLVFILHFAFFILHLFALPALTKKLVSL